MMLVTSVLWRSVVDQPRLNEALAQKFIALAAAWEQKLATVTSEWCASESQKALAGAEALVTALGKNGAQFLCDAGEKYTLEKNYLNAVEAYAQALPSGHHAVHVLPDMYKRYATALQTNKCFGGTLSPGQVFDAIGSEYVRDQDSLIHNAELCALSAHIKNAQSAAAALLAQVKLPSDNPGFWPQHLHVGVPGIFVDMGRSKGASSCEFFGKKIIEIPAAGEPSIAALHRELEGMLSPSKGRSRG